MDCFLTGCPVNYKGSSGAAIGNPFREIGGEIWHRAKWFRNNEHTDRMDNTGGKKYECRNNYEADKCKEEPVTANLKVMQSDLEMFDELKGLAQ